MGLEGLGIYEKGLVVSSPSKADWSLGAGHKMAQVLLLMNTSWCVCRWEQ